MKTWSLFQKLTMGVIVMMPASARGQNAPTRLRLTNSTPLSLQGPALGNQGSVRCDGQGNMYLRPVISMVPGMNETAPVVRVTRAGIQDRSFSLRDVTGPDKFSLTITQYGQSLDSLRAFSIGRTGRVYLVARRCLPTRVCSSEVVQYSQNGKYQTDTKLDATDLMPEAITLFGDGYFFITGLSEGGGHPISSFAGIFQQDGKLLARVHFPGEDAAEPAAQVVLPFVATDGDRTIFVVRSVINPVLYVIDEDGTVVAHPIAPPFKNALPLAMKYAGNSSVIVQFGTMVDANRVTSTGDFFSLVDSDGRIISNYTADEKTGGLFGCFIPTSGFEFLRYSSNGTSSIRFAQVK